MLDLFDCPICYEPHDTLVECAACHQQICHGCSRSIRRSLTVASACPFCRTAWTEPMGPASDTLAEWRRRLRLSRQVTEWVITPTLTAAAADPFRPDSTAGIVAAAQVILMGVWFWSNA